MKNRNYLLLLPALLAAVSFSFAGKPAVFSSGQCKTVWENSSPRLYSIVRNNLFVPVHVSYTFDGPGVSQSGFLSIQARDQDSLYVQVPSLPLGSHDFVLALWDTSAVPDTLFWTSTSSVLVVDSTLFLSVEPDFFPAVIDGDSPLTYPATPKKTVVKVPKNASFSDPRSSSISWSFYITNADPNDPGNLLVVSPDSGSVVAIPGEEFSVLTFLDAESPVAPGTINTLNMLVSIQGTTMLHVCTPVVTDQLGALPIATGVPDAEQERSSWGGIKTIFR